eukprot:4908885-Alexandrium_andersonii.AAC.1
MPTRTAVHGVCAKVSNCMQGVCPLKQRLVDLCINETGGGCDCKQRIRRAAPSVEAGAAGEIAAMTCTPIGRE